MKYQIIELKKKMITNKAKIEELEQQKSKIEIEQLLEAGKQLMEMMKVTCNNSNSINQPVVQSKCPLYIRKRSNSASGK